MSARLADFALPCSLGVSRVGLLTALVIGLALGGLSGGLWHSLFESAGQVSTGSLDTTTAHAAARSEKILASADQPPRTAQSALPVRPSPEAKHLQAELDAIRNDTQAKIRSALAAFHEMDRERAKTILDSWKANEFFKRVIGHPGMLAEQMQDHFSAGVAAELAVLYYSAVGFICTRKLFPLTHDVGNGPWDDKLAPAWQQLYKEWDARVRSFEDMKNLIRGEIRRVAGDSGLVLLQRVVIPDVPRDSPDYKDRCRRLDERYVLKAWRFILE